MVLSLLNRVSINLFLLNRGGRGDGGMVVMCCGDDGGDGDDVAAAMGLHYGVAAAMATMLLQRQWQ